MGKQIKIRKTFTFTVDVDAFAAEYGIGVDEVREMFTRDVESYTDPREWCLAWEAYVRSISVSRSA